LVQLDRRTARLEVDLNTVDLGTTHRKGKWSYLKWQSVVLAANFTDMHFMIDVCMSGTEKYLD
jgi:hypothetical protein